MGCDIHVHLEVKIDGQWHHYSVGEQRRSYRLFGKMAGVRDEEVEPISPPKGLPEDVSFMTKLDSDIWGEDGHSHSWLSSDELLELMEWINLSSHICPECGTYQNVREHLGWEWREFGVWLFGNSIGNWKEYREDFPKQLQDIRLVFWFDN